MSEEKQIKEMARVIKSSLDGLGSGNFNFTGYEISTMFAKALYKAGYGKQKELIEENERLNLALLATTERSESRKEADISEILELRLKVDELSKENERLIDKHSENERR